MGTRYTNKAMSLEVDTINAQLEAMDSKFRLDAGSRYNYSAIDVQSVEQFEWPQKRVGNSGCLRTLETGTPRECITAAYRFLNSSEAQK